MPTAFLYHERKLKEIVSDISREELCDVSYVGLPT